LAVDATSVYWAFCGADNGGVMKVPLTGGSSVTLSSGQGCPFAVAVDATSVYWTEHAGGSVMTVPLGGGTPVALASGRNQPWGITVDAVAVYWTGM